MGINSYNFLIHNSNNANKFWKIVKRKLLKNIINFLKEEIRVRDNKINAQINKNKVLKIVIQ